MRRALIKITGPQWPITDGRAISIRITERVLIGNKFGAGYIQRITKAGIFLCFCYPQRFFRRTHEESIMGPEGKKQTLPPQHQTTQPGVESSMRPRPHSSATEYVGSGKLNGKVAII